MRAENTDTVNCPSCGATLVAGLRFCRRCGYRLGEGVEEYIATQRFDGSSMPTAAAPPPATDPFAARQTWGAAPIQPFGANSALAAPPAAPWAKPCSTKRGGWWLWLTIALVLLIAGGMIPLSLMSRNRARGGGGGDNPPAVNSLLAEADEFDTADGGGAMIRGLAGPGTSLEAAGLVGGDIITVYGGKPVRDGASIKRLIAQSPPGQPVPVTYVRDGETRQTTVTPGPGGTFRGMEPVRQRPGGRAVLNVDFDDGDRVRVPGTNMYGVELDDVERNGPADLAGLKKGDIIVEFDGKPIRTAGDLRYRAGAATPLGVIPVVVFREGQLVTIPVKMGRQR
ncbi:MAG TPA: PDZ domain-containing protein [Pyrinomonadaceae bacterium]|jgi:membrane-associated protease RseP (regulator of RpoE activity)